MMIEIKNLSFSYGKKKQSVFNDFSLTLDKGSVYGLLGKNGTGKSTLLYLMTGLRSNQKETYSTGSHRYRSYQCRWKHTA